MTIQRIIPADTEARIARNFRERIWLGTVTTDSPTVTVTPDVGGDAVTVNPGGHTVAETDRVLVYSHDRGSHFVIANLG